ncbi:MAG TPA: HD domain-containing protein [Thermoleophilaceae bacterium]|nr:HD domain-containing protein [Thermoleophilaceae bacterium]
MAVQIAQTNLQLFNQLRERGLAIDELVEIRHAYELLTTLYAGHYQADGKPFVSHGVGVASILASLDQPAEIVSVGLLHNVYGNADFGDGVDHGITPSRRELVRAAVGARVEELLARFQELRIDDERVRHIRQELAGWDESDRRLVLVELADHLEKYVDLGVLYFGENDWIVGRTERAGADLMELAEELGQPRLAAMLGQAFDDAAAHAKGFPAELRPTAGRRYLEVIIPRSCEPRRSLRRRLWIARVRAHIAFRLRRSLAFGRRGYATLRARRTA